MRLPVCTGLRGAEDHKEEEGEAQYHGFGFKPADVHGEDVLEDGVRDEGRLELVLAGRGGAHLVEDDAHVIIVSVSKGG